MLLLCYDAVIDDCLSGQILMLELLLSLMFERAISVEIFLEIFLGFALIGASYHHPKTV